MFKKGIKNNLYNIAWLLVMALFFISDRLLKKLALNRQNEEMINLIPDWLYFDFQANENIAFSLPVSNYVASILALVLIIGLIFSIFYLIKKKRTNKLIIVLLSFITLGAISNLIDRLQYSFVIDYLNVPWFTVFNLADVMISLGGIALIIILIFKNK